MRIDIRPALPSDSAGIAAFGAQTDARHIFVLLCDGTVSAVCTADDCRKKGYFGYAEILQLYVCEQIRRTGCGRKLLSYMLRGLRERGYRNAVLVISDGNAQGRSFFEKFGFRAVSMAKGADTDGITEVIYTIEL